MTTTELPTGIDMGGTPAAASVPPLTEDSFMGGEHEQGFLSMSDDFRDVSPGEGGDQASEAPGSSNELSGSSGAEAQGAEQSAPQAEAPATQAGEPAGLPTHLAIDGKEVPFSEIESLYKAAAEVPNLVDFGRTYANVVQAFNSGPEGARKVIEAMAQAAIDNYGPQVDLRGISEITALDPASMTPTERTLYGMVQSARQETAQVRAEALKAFETVKPRIEDARQLEVATANVAKIQTLIPGAQVTPEQLVRMQKETGIADPVAAYKVATYDTRPSGAAKTTAPQSSPKMPRGTPESKTFDVNDPTLTIGDRVELMKQGYTPVAGKKA